ncbi:MAG: HNH endonuclease family protein [Ornithinibacter sp.]
MSTRAWFGWGGVGVAGLALVLGLMGGPTTTPPTPAHPAATPSRAPTTASTTATTPASADPSDAASTPTSPPTRASATAPASANPASALAAVAGLTVKGRAPRTGYSREQFGQAWFDADRNGCDTRNDILRRDLVDRQMKNWCKVLAGTRNPDPYTGRTIRFVIGGPSEIDVDHVVALADAWQKGAATWQPGIRLAFANDPLALLAVDSGTNRSKGDGDAATWLPPDRSSRCAYVARQVAVKAKYRLWVTAAERDAMVRVLSTCPSMPLPR